MNFIRDNIVKILIGLVLLIVIVIVVVACSGGRTRVVSNDTGYIEMENKLQNAAIRLTSKNKTLLPKTINVTKKITLNSLIEQNLLNEFTAVEDKNVKCTGYVDIIKKDPDREDYRYTPYIKCGKYYETRTISEHIIENEPIVAQGQGLYQVEVKKEVENVQIQDQNKENTEEVEPQKYYMYYYKGEYPNNYIVIGDALYRIIEITEEGYLKVISTVRTASSYIWDNRYNVEKKKYYGINEFDKSRMKDNLEFLFYNSDPDAGEVYFNDSDREYFIPHEYCVGKRKITDVAIAASSECDIKEELPMGLVSIYEYYRASTSTQCSEIGQLQCNNYNYFFSIDNNRNVVLTTLTGNADNTYEVYQIYYGSLNSKRASIGKYLYPVLYVNKNILYKSGTGSSKDPYIVR